MLPLSDAELSALLHCTVFDNLYFCVDLPNKRQCLQNLNTLSPSRNCEKLSKTTVPVEDNISSKLAWFSNSFYTFSFFDTCQLLAVIFFYHLCYFSEHGSLNYTNSVEYPVSNVPCQLHSYALPKHPPPPHRPPDSVQAYNLACDTGCQVHLCLSLCQKRLLPAFSPFAVQTFNNLSSMSVTCPLPTGTITSPQPSVKLSIHAYN